MPCAEGDGRDGSTAVHRGRAAAAPAAIRVAHKCVTPGLTEVATGGYDSAMRAVGIKTLRNKLSEYVRVAANGETILVTDRDRVVAELGPPQGGRAPDVSDALLADVVRRGWLRPPVVASNVLPPRKPVMPLAEVLHDLDADRRDR
jgi:antitoxin (DNA-binding transcriptional repressor) of toxin-antitoxin stability system